MARSAALLLLLCAAALAAQPLPFESPDGRWGYRDGRGRIVIAPRYRVAQPFSRGLAAVFDEPGGWAYIDRKGAVVVRPVPFDNGPDYFREGLVRIVREGKYGFADRRGRVAIPPRFDFAEPFAGGRARVCVGCRAVSMGEHRAMEGGKWGVIDRTGRLIGPLN